MIPVTTGMRLPPVRGDPPCVGGTGYRDTLGTPHTPRIPPGYPRISPYTGRMGATRNERAPSRLSIPPATSRKLSDAHVYARPRSPARTSPVTPPPSPGRAPRPSCQLISSTRSTAHFGALPSTLSFATTRPSSLGHLEPVSSRYPSRALPSSADYEGVLLRAAEADRAPRGGRSRRSVEVPGALGPPVVVVGAGARDGLGGGGRGGHRHRGLRSIPGRSPRPGATLSG